MEGAVHVAAPWEVGRPRSCWSSLLLAGVVVDSELMPEAASAAAAAAVPEMEEEEERYVMVASRFFRVKPRGGGAMAGRLHYLEACFLCQKSIACNRDIFMYKGDAAFCSGECRQEQMDMDEALHAVARRQRLLQRKSQGEPASSSGPPAMRRRPTIANLAARNPPVAAS